MNLTLVGVVHRDPEGYQRLLSILEEVRPEAIGVELSPLGLAWRERNRDRLLGKLQDLLMRLGPDAKGHPQISLIREALEIPFEFRASMEHSRRHGVPVHLLDLNRISREELPLLEKEVLTHRNLRVLLGVGGPSVEQQVASAYRKAWLCLEGRLSLWEAGVRPPWTDGLSLLREKYLACRIRGSLASHRSFLYAGGWVHLVEDPNGPTVARILEDLRPRKMILRQKVELRECTDLFIQ